LRVIFLAVCTLLLTGGKAVFAEPIPVKNHSPIFFGVLFPVFDSPATLPDGDKKLDVSFDYSSMFHFRHRDGWTAGYDMDVTETTFVGRFGISSLTEVSIESSVMRLGGGFLDKALLDYHKFLGVKDSPGPQDAPPNIFVYNLERNGKKMNSPPSHTFFLGDTSLSVKRVFKNGESWGVAGKSVLQIPTASTSAGLGTGSYQFAFLLLADKEFGNITIDGNIGYVVPGFIDRGRKESLNNFGIMRVGGSYKLSGSVTLIAQTVYSTAPFIEKSWLAVTLGGRYTTQAGRKINIGFLEDINTAAPDFTLHISTSF